MKWWCLVMTAAVGCGGSKHGANDPAAEARAAELKRLEAMRPARPYDVKSIAGYRAPDTCGQGPYRIEAKALGSQFGEQFEVNICAPRSLQGDYRLTRGTDAGEPRHFGSRNNSEHCLATAAEAAQRGTSATDSSTSGGTSGGTGGGTSGRTSGRTSTAATASSSSSTAAAAPTALIPVTERVGETCPAGMFLSGIVDFTSEMQSGDGVPWKAGTALIVDVWSAEPLHLDGAIFVVIQRGVRAGMTADQWLSYRNADAEWTKIWNAYLDGQVTAGHMTVSDGSARTEAPPPPRIEIKPPQPSTHAEWIAGYWQRDREWIWSPGFWRVPEADIVAEQTIEAPVAPPPMKAEAPPVAPIAQPVAPPQPVAVNVAVTAAPPPPPPTVSVNMVWTPGYWSWNGTAYIWIEGAWRIPPQGEARWVAPTWTSRRGRFVLKPGGWSIRIGR
jgi:hypothetical protein